MSKTESVDETLTFTVAELEQRLCEEATRNKLLVSGFLRETGTSLQPWNEAIVEYSRRLFENWEDPVNFILPGDVSKANALRAEGNALFAQKHYASAIAKYEDANRWNPNDHLAKCNSALCYARIGNWSLCFEDAKSAILQRADYCKAWLRLAEACSHLGQVIPAAFAFRIAHSISKSQSQFSAKRVKSMKKLSRDFEQTLSADHLDNVKRLRKGKLLSRLEIMLLAFGNSRLREFYKGSVKLKTEMFNETRFKELQLQQWLQEFGRVAQAKDIVPRLSERISECNWSISDCNWCISWSAEHWFSNMDPNDGKDKRFLDLERQFGEEYAYDVCFPNYLTHANRKQQPKRSFVIYVHNNTTDKVMFRSVDYGVPSARRLADSLLHAMVAPMNGSLTSLPSTILLSYRIRHESDEIKRIMRAIVGDYVWILDEMRHVAFNGAIAEGNDPNGWNQDY